MKTEGLLTLSEVLARTGLAQSTYYGLMASGKAPRPILPSTARVMWSRKDVDNFLMARRTRYRTDWRGTRRSVGPRVQQ